MSNLCNIPPMIEEIPATYKPPFGLGSPHVQNLLSSSSFRRRLIERRNARILKKSHTMTLDCGNGVKLLGELNESTSPSKGLVILLHGWEGSSQSGYMVSATSSLLRAGFDVFRLNFRDHGDSHHLNRGLFHSALQEEVIGAVAAVQKRWHAKPRYFLAGFSLGGNFALRVALKEHCLPAPISHVFSVCPVLDPANSMAAMTTTWRLYEGYFRRKWKRSLMKKLSAFSSYDYALELGKMKSLQEMNEFFIPRYTPLATLEQYYSAYTLTGDKLNQLKTTATMLVSEDDPIIPHDDLNKIARLPNLKVEVTQNGGHCAFLDSYSLTSWADKRMVQVFQEAAAQADADTPIRQKPKVRVRPARQSPEPAAPVVKHAGDRPEQDSERLFRQQEKSAQQEQRNQETAWIR